jgi:5-methylcytosine-specific restriction protein A
MIILGYFGQLNYSPVEYFRFSKNVRFLRLRLAEALDRAHVPAMHKRNLAPAQTMPVRAWYNLQSWRRRAKHQLHVAPLCALCREAGRTTPATIADHFPPHAGNYNAFVLGPLRSLCKPCHDGLQPSFKHKGYRPDIGVDGFPLDPAHPWYRGR